MKASGSGIRAALILGVLAAGAQAQQTPQGPGSGADRCDAYIEYFNTTSAWMHDAFWALWQKTGRENRTTHVQTRPWRFIGGTISRELLRGDVDSLEFWNDGLKQNLYATARWASELGDAAPSPELAEKAIDFTEQLERRYVLCAADQVSELRIP